ncbi:hypothetical protein J4222_04460 [Candidatus Woesearchaeota archaeon]|nr:hypothetical protein [Candidatus Woesearchaeota archaeon]
MESKKPKTEVEFLDSIDKKMDLLILMVSLSGKDKKEQTKILKSYKGPFSKRELEKITGIDRHEF